MDGMYALTFSIAGCADHVVRSVLFLNSPGSKKHKLSVRQIRHDDDQGASITNNLNLKEVTSWERQIMR